MSVEWLNLHTSTLDSPEFLGAEPLDRATWLCLLRYCIGQENSGIIDNCADWSDRKWQQLCRVTQRELRRKCDLFEWLDGSLVVKMYPVEKEKEVKRLRAQAKAGADARWDASRHRSGICHEDASRHADGMAQGMPDGICGREGKGREGEGGGNMPAPTPKALPSEGKPELEANRERLKKFARRKLLATNPEAIDELLGLARDCGCNGVQQTIDMIDWAVEKAREKPAADVRFARHFQHEARAWAKMKKETERIVQVAT